MRPVGVAERSNLASSTLRAPTLSSPSQDWWNSQRPAALARLTQPLYLGLLAGSTNRAMPRRWQAVYWFNTYETFQAASALWLKFLLYACMGVVCPSA